MEVSAYFKSTPFYLMSLSCVNFQKSLSFTASLSPEAKAARLYRSKSGGKETKNTLQVRALTRPPLTVEKKRKLRAIVFRDNHSWLVNFVLVL